VTEDSSEYNLFLYSNERAIYLTSYKFT